MNTAIVSQVGQSAGISFAVPINSISRILDQLIVNGRVIRADLGITRVYSTGEGLLVIDLVERRAGRAGRHSADPHPGRAAQPGIVRESLDRESADLIVAVEHKRVHTVEELLNEVEKNRPGDTVRITVIRDGKARRRPGPARPLLIAIVAHAALCGSQCRCHPDTIFKRPRQPPPARMNLQAGLVVRNRAFSRRRLHVVNNAEERGLGRSDRLMADRLDRIAETNPIQLQAGEDRHTVLHRHGESSAECTPLGPLASDNVTVPEYPLSRLPNWSSTATLTPNAWLTPIRTGGSEITANRGRHARRHGEAARGHGHVLAERSPAACIRCPRGQRQSGKRRDAILRRHRQRSAECASSGVIAQGNVMVPLKFCSRTPAAFSTSDRKTERSPACTLAGGSAVTTSLVADTIGGQVAHDEIGSGRTQAGHQVIARPGARSRRSRRW